ncbi:MAG: TPD domain-containing protein [Candidatus Micrarchaeota archaeon]
MIVSAKQYRHIYSLLHSKADLNALSKRFRLPRETLESILHQKLVRRVRTHFHRLRTQAGRLEREWRAGRTFMQIAAENSFSPLMTASIILQHKGMSKPAFSRLAKNPALAKDERIRREVGQAIESDAAFSQKTIAEQTRRAKECEQFVAEWLTRQGASFKHESQQAKTGKTPDYLLEKPLLLHGHEIKWVECKASFGDREETKRNLSRQLSHYLQLFGPGMVVYWYGVEEHPFTHKGVLVVTRDYLE